LGISLPGGYVSFPRLCL